MFSTFQGPLGCRSFNSVLQRRFNREDQERNPLLLHDPAGAYTFRKNDKVMQIVNDYNKDVFNGEIGRVARTEDGALQVEMNRFCSSSRPHFSSPPPQVKFPNSVAAEGGGSDESAHRLVEYGVDEVQNLDPAYAITIHKAQGCEFPVTVIPIHSLYNSVLQRNLLYTAVTRATKLTVVVGDARAVHEAIARTDSNKRKTRLEKLLKD